MRQFLLGMLIGLLLGTAGTLWAQWGNDPTVQQGFRDFSLEQRYMQDLRTLPQPSPWLGPVQPMPFGRQPC